MKPFLDEHFLLKTKTAQQLYHEFAKDMPIIDYHCHLPQLQIKENTRFENLTRVWLNGDHYKWRAMRINGIDESYITGNRTDREKFMKWAETVPYAMRNPLYHWTHLELQRYFGIYELLNPKSAERIYEECSEKLSQEDYRVRGLLEKMNVKKICTTDDPVDDLSYHRALHTEGYSIQVLPAFRPDKAMELSDLLAFKRYVERLEEASGMSISHFSDYLDALKKRHDYFHDHGARISDHGLEEIYAEDYTEQEVARIFEKALLAELPSVQEQKKFKSAMLVYFAEWDADRGWVQQYHLGALRNNNSRKLGQLGPDTGWDSIGDFTQGRQLSKFLNKLDGKDKLAKTILYNLNPADNELMATMIGNYNDGSVPGKVQYGAAWWFLDQKDGMSKQLNALSNMGLLSRFIGMLTDSRSFLSFPRHEYFRRLLCDLLGSDVENGELPPDIEWLGQLVKNISYNNIEQYVDWPK